MYLTTNYPIFNDFFIVKTKKTLQYASYKDYYYGDSNLTLRLPNSVHLDITSQCSNIYKLTELIKVKNANKLFKLFIWQSALFYYTKIKFTGKGYKIKKIKKKESLKLYFGRSHFNYLFGGGLNLKKVSKYRLLLISNNQKKNNTVTKILCSTRWLNKFTKRGLRPLKFFILKRPGKKTNY